MCFKEYKMSNTTLHVRYSTYFCFFIGTEPPCSQAMRLYNERKGLLGRMKPACDKDGFYRSRQCHENYCWCVDRFNRKIEGTEARGSVECRKYFNYFNKRTCSVQKSRRILYEKPACKKQSFLSLEYCENRQQV